jgi:predicted deacylase
MSANERMIVGEEFISYEKFLWILLSEAQLHNLPVEVIGYETCKRTGIGYPLYRLVIHPNAPLSVCIVAGIHGNEIAEPLSVIYIISAILHELPQQYRYVIYPMINPSGFDLRERLDGDRRDLNAIYNVTLNSDNYNEVQVFYQDVLKFTPFEVVIALHEDSDQERFYMYGLGKENLGYYHAICEFARSLVPAWTEADIYGCHSDDHGLVLSTARDHAFDGALYKNGLTKVAYTLETPGKLDIHFRVNMMVQLVHLSMEMLNAKRWMTTV